MQEKYPQNVEHFPSETFLINTVGWSDWIIYIEGLIMKACDSVQKVSEELYVSVREHF